MENMIELSNRARAFAYSKGFQAFADDFAQEVYISLSGGRKATFKRLLVDFMRQNFGDTRYPNSMKNKLQYHSEIDPDLMSTPAAEFESDFDTVVKMVEPRDRTILILKYYWGLEQCEIAHALGISEGRVTQLLKDIMLRLRKKVK